jgi:hypothetical protein
MFYQVLLVTQVMFPETPLPKAGLASFDPRVRQQSGILVLFAAFAYPALNQQPANGEVIMVGG